MKNILFLLVFLVGCAGSPAYNSMRLSGIQKTIGENNEKMYTLRIDMTMDMVLTHMGRRPEKSEGYDWGSVWFYRTAMNHGIYRTGDNDLTPLLFDKRGRLRGWGRNYYDGKIQYEIKIKTEGNHDPQ